MPGPHSPVRASPAFAAASASKPGPQPRCPLLTGCQSFLIRTSQSPECAILFPKRGVFMSTAADFTLRETATLSGAPLSTIEKAVESRIVLPVRAPAKFRGAARRYVPLKAVGFFHALVAADLKDLPTRHKRSLWTCILESKTPRPKMVEFAPGAVIEFKRLSSDCLVKADQYRKARDKHIISNPNILGGTPVIAGTRLTVYAILGRLHGGETISDLVQDYPEVLPGAFEAAEIFARAHPLRGRPSGRPWRQTA